MGINVHGDSVVITLIRVLVPMYRKAWIALGNMPKDEARQGLIKLLDAATPRLKDTILQQWREKKRQEEKERLDWKVFIYLCVCVCVIIFILYPYSEPAEEDTIKQRDANATKVCVCVWAGCLGG